ncbi:MAG: hypothetical protein LBL49_02640 [Clostridiales Family XIII bacterium]|nr:hypothetical protein [Clostridiales Family XIII bacterium]
MILLVSVVLSGCSAAVVQDGGYYQSDQYGFSVTFPNGFADYYQVADNDGLGVKFLLKSPSSSDNLLCVVSKESVFQTRFTDKAPGIELARVRETDADGVETEYVYALRYAGDSQDEIMNAKYAELTAELAAENIVFSLLGDVISQVITLNDVTDGSNRQLDWPYPIKDNVNEDGVYFYEFPAENGQFFLVWQLDIEYITAALENGVLKICAHGSGETTPGEYTMYEILLDGVPITKDQIPYTDIEFFFQGNTAECRDVTY